MKRNNPLLTYENMWVALNPKSNEVIVAANDVKTLARKLDKLRIDKKEAVLTRVFPFDRAYSP